MFCSTLFNAFGFGFRMSLYSYGTLARTRNSLSSVQFQGSFLGSELYVCKKPREYFQWLILGAFIAISVMKLICVGKLP